MSRRYPKKHPEQVTRWGTPTHKIHTVQGRISYKQWCEAEAIRMHGRVEYTPDGYCAAFAEVVR